MTTIATPSAALDQLRTVLPGQVHLLGDADWDEHRLAWARSVHQQPVAVVTARDAHDVVAAVRCAVLHGLDRVGSSRSATAPPPPSAARSSVRTRGLQDISVDADNRIAWVGAGVKRGELLAHTAPHGLTGLAGSSPTRRSSASA